MYFQWKSRKYPELINLFISLSYSEKKPIKKHEYSKQIILGTKTPIVINITHI